MKNLLLFVVHAILLMTCTSANAQQSFGGVSYKEIKTWVSENKESYDSLLSRFCNADTLSEEEAFKLYYGYSFTDKYKAMYSEDDATFEAYNSDNAEAAYSAYQKEYEKNPVFLRTLFRLVVLSDYLGKEEDKGRYSLQFRQLVKAVWTSGNGSEAHPLYVICVPDEYILIKVLFGNFELEGQSLVGTCDVMKCKMKEDGSVNTYWFNVSRHFEALQEQMKSK